MIFPHKRQWKNHSRFLPFITSMRSSLLWHLVVTRASHTWQVSPHFISFTLLVFRNERFRIWRGAVLISILIRNSHRDGLNHLHWAGWPSVFICGVNIKSFLAAWQPLRIQSSALLVTRLEPKLWTGDASLRMKYLPPLCLKFLYELICRPFSPKQKIRELF